MRSVVFASVAFGLIASTSVNAAALQERAAACAPLPAGWGPKPKIDCASEFVALSALSSAANTAPTPSGYVKQYSDLKAATIASQCQYLSFVYLKKYDANLCASKCNAIKGCNSFNLYFERDPCYEPGKGCENPESTTNIKCAFFGDSITSASAINRGQFRAKFEFVIAGSNGYTKTQYLINQAAAEIRSNTAQSYCSSILGYTTPVVSTTVVATSTPRGITASTFVATNLAMTTVTIPSTSTIISTEIVTTTLTLPTTATATSTDSTTATVESPTFTIVPATTIVGTVTLTSPTTTTTTSTSTAPFINAMSKREVTSWTTIDGKVLLALPTFPSSKVDQKRAIQPPPCLSKYPPSIITSACSLVVSPVTVTRTVTRTSTSTISTAFSTRVVSITTTDIATSTVATTISLLGEDSTTTKTAITMPTVTVTSNTLFITTVTEVPTATITLTFNAVATETTSPTITTTTVTTTTAAPACTSTGYNFQVVSGTYQGTYLQTGVNRIYDFVRFASGTASTTPSWTIRADGRVYGATNDYAWITAGDQYNNVFYAVEAIRNAFNVTTYLLCSVVSSDAVARVPGATGALSCRIAGGDNVLLGSCPSGGDNLFQFTQADGDRMGCAAATIAAIPLSNC